MKLRETYPTRLALLYYTKHIVIDYTPISRMSSSFARTLAWCFANCFSASTLGAKSLTLDIICSNKSGSGVAFKSSFSRNVVLGECWKRCMAVLTAEKRKENLISETTNGTRHELKPMQTCVHNEVCQSYPFPFSMFLVQASLCICSGSRQSKAHTSGWRAVTHRLPWVMPLGNPTHLSAQSVNRHSAHRARQVLPSPPAPCRQYDPPLPWSPLVATEGSALPQQCLFAKDKLPRASDPVFSFQRETRE
jgi:hypothetical protein